MQLLLAILLGKLIAYFSRLLKIGGGSAAPGLYALKIDPNLVEKLSTRISKNVIITGTNGKTTTARMLALFLKESGLKVIRNHTGSNLERGIASALISHYTLYPKPYTLDLGIWELDEAAFNLVAPKFKPDVVVFLNVFRDQLDRYGEINTVVKNWSKTLTTLPAKTIILVNGDDANTSRLASYFNGQVFKFGVRDYKIVGEGILHKKEKENLDFEAKNVRLNGLKGSSFELKIENLKLKIDLPLPGVYHIYDALAAIAAASHLLPTINYQLLTTFQPAFGRVEKLPFGYIFLIKNPAGATQVFETVAPNLKPNDRLLLALNDNLADGTDVSWIWDADFEILLSPSLRAKRSNLLKRLPRHFVPRNDVVVSGTRAADLALRLKYAGFDPDSILVEPNLERALRQARRGLKGRLFILPTYTALLSLQRILAAQGLKQHYWQDQ